MTRSRRAPYPSHAVALVLGAVFLPPAVAAQGAAEAGAAPERPLVWAAARAGEIRLDGVLDDLAWAGATPRAGFVQREPLEGVPAEADTEVRVLFDDDAVWVGIRAWDPDPASVRRQLYRRDGAGRADFVEVGIDPHLDQRSGYLFQVSASNVQVDGEQHADFNGDSRADFAFADRDFNVRSLVGNLVLRWEYRPGSIVFLVWQRSQAEEVSTGDFDFRRDSGALWRAPADDRFVVKVNYWWGL